MNNNETQSIGEAICNSVRLISKAGIEIEALRTVIESEVNKAIANEELGNDVKEIEGWYHDEAYDDYGWVAHMYQFYLGISHKKRRSSVERYLYFSVCLDPEQAFGGVILGEKAVIEISLWNDSFKDQVCVLKNEVLFDYAPNAKSWNEQCWSYCLYLDSINNVNDIKSKIIQPISALFNENDPGKADLPLINGIVRYEEKRVEGETVYVPIA